MSYVQRRRFLWILFLAGIALVAVVANATTLARLSFDDLAMQSAAVARLRCLSSESAWDGGEIWTETRFEVVERNKGLLGGSVTVRMLGGRAGNFYSTSGWRAGVSRRGRGVPVFMGKNRRNVPGAGLVAGNVSDFAGCTQRPGKRLAGFGVSRGSIRS